MSAISGHSSLLWTNNAILKQMLADYPLLSQYWDFDSHNSHLDVVDRCITGNKLSHGDLIMQRFFVAV